MSDPARPTRGLSHRPSGLLIAFPAGMPPGRFNLCDDFRAPRSSHNRKKNRGGQPRGSMPFWVAVDFRWRGAAQKSHSLCPETKSDP
jgi:hypothetical protein